MDKSKKEKKKEEEINMKYHEINTLLIFWTLVV